MKNYSYALIIGINTYEDSRLGNLRGCRNDAIAWWRLCVRHLRIPAEQITVLASPPLTPEELGDDAAGTRLGGASHADIHQALSELAGGLAAGEHTGLLTFSGHGVVAGADPGGVEGEDLALCPSDTSLNETNGDAAAVDNVLRFRAMSELFRARHTHDNLTVVLDACYSGSGSSGHPSHRHLLGPTVVQDPARLVQLAMQSGAATPVGSRLILGAEHWSPAFEVRVGTEWRGAASWALCALMEQWACKRAGGASYLNVSYGDLIQRARTALDTFGVAQTPVMWGPRRLDELPVMKQGLAIQPGTTSKMPDVWRDRRQIPVETGKWALIKLRLEDDNGDTHHLADVVVAGPPEGSPRSSTLAWTVDGHDQTLTVSQGHEYWLQKYSSGDRHHVTTHPKLNFQMVQLNDFGNHQGDFESTLEDDDMGSTAAFIVPTDLSSNGWQDPGSVPSASYARYFYTSDTLDANYLGIYISQDSDLALQDVRFYVYTGSGGYSPSSHSYMLFDDSQADIPESSPLVFNHESSSPPTTGSYEYCSTADLDES